MTDVHFKKKKKKKRKYKSFASHPINCNLNFSLPVSEKRQLFLKSFPSTATDKLHWLTQETNYGNGEHVPAGQCHAGGHNQTVDVDGRSSDRNSAKDLDQKDKLVPN